MHCNLMELLAVVLPTFFFMCSVDAFPQRFHAISNEYQDQPATIFVQEKENTNSGAIVMKSFF